jgi:hypothetical protein
MPLLLQRKHARPSPQQQCGNATFTRRLGAWANCLAWIAGVSFHLYTPIIDAEEGILHSTSRLSIRQKKSPRARWVPPLAALGEGSRRYSSVQAVQLQLAKAKKKKKKCLVARGRQVAWKTQPNQRIGMRGKLPSSETSRRTQPSTFIPGLRNRERIARQRLLQCCLQQAAALHALPRASTSCGISAQGAMARPRR